MILGLLIPVGAYVLGLMGTIPMMAAPALGFIVTFLQSSAHRRQTLQWLKESVFQKVNMKPKPMLYTCVTLFMIVLFIV
jgi:hypothetical protein